MPKLPKKIFGDIHDVIAYDRIYSYELRDERRNIIIKKVCIIN